MVSDPKDFPDSYKACPSYQIPRDGFLSGHLLTSYVAKCTKKYCFPTLADAIGSKRFFGFLMITLIEIHRPGDFLMAAFADA